MHFMYPNELVGMSYSVTKETFGRTTLGIFWLVFTTSQDQPNDTRWIVTSQAKVHCVGLLLMNFLQYNVIAFDRISLC